MNNIQPNELVQLRTLNAVCNHLSHFPLGYWFPYSRSMEYRARVVRDVTYNYGQSRILYLEIERRPRGTNYDPQIVGTAERWC